MCLSASCSSLGSTSTSSTGSRHHHQVAHCTACYCIRSLLLIAAQGPIQKSIRSAMDTATQWLAVRVEAASCSTQSDESVIELAPRVNIAL